MDRADVFATLTEVFEDVFQADDLTVHDGTVAADIPGWDSLSNIQMVLAVERRFKIRMTAAQVSGLKDVGSLVTVIQKKLPHA
ncbi:acyl carrier protein [Sphingomonas sp.]|uniref:acyl carrier protein n=1 Tax=Sphingomonas sp. TaxID=28214 RepID=UPI003B007186